MNNAGTNIPESFKRKKILVRNAIECKYKAAFNIAQLCANQIIKLKKKQGSIINISLYFFSSWSKKNSL